MNDIDIAVVGAGTAGLTAGRHAAAGGAKTLVLDRMGVGGQVSTVEGITNFPDHPEPIAGYELGVRLFEEAESAGAEIKLAEVESITPAEQGYVLDTGAEQIIARTVVLAAGSERRSLGLEGEKTFEGRGVSHCASCDGPFYQQKTAVVVGGGDSAVDEAIILSGYAQKVLIVHHGAQLTAREEVAGKLDQHSNIEVVPHTTVTGIQGEQKVEEVTLQNVETGEQKTQSADGLFVYIGLSPNTEWLAELVERTPGGHVVIDEALATSRPGVFAAGDIRSGTAALLSESVEDGKKAAESALASLR